MATALDNENASLEWPDILAIVLYFVIVLGAGLWASCRATTDNASGFFLAGRTMHWIPIGASTFSTNIGAPMFLGLAGSAAATGISVTMFEWHAMWMLLLLGWVFLPVYIASGCYTMPQYLKLRFGGRRIRVWLAVVYTFVTIISAIAGQMYAGAVFIQQIFKWDLYLSIVLILGITSIFTILGGLSAVIWTDTVQTAILIIGSFTVGGITLNNLGGFEVIRHRFLKSGANYTFRDVSFYGNRTCGFPPDDSFHIFRAADSGDYPWPGMVFGLTILALNAWCTDQTCVQRSLSAKNMCHAKAGVTLAAYLKVLSFMFFVIPGMASRVLYPDEVGCADPEQCDKICGNKAGCTDIAYPLLVLRVLPVGIRGIMMAALLSALISSLTSIFNSSSTVFTMDLYSICRPRAKEAELMVVGRLWIVLLAIVGTLWLPVLELIKGSQFWSYTQSISAFLNPPIVMTFLFGIFWTRATEKGVFAGLVVGLACGLIRMGLEWSHVAPPCGSDEPDDRFEIVSKVHYLHFAMILAAVTSIVIVVVSLFTEPRTEAQLRRVTWWTRFSVEPQQTDSDAEEEEDEKPKQPVDPNADVDPGMAEKLRLLALKWFCGVDRRAAAARPSRSKEDIAQSKLQANSIHEDPFWKRVVDINGIVCCMCCVFLHGFWF